MGWSFDINNYPATSPIPVYSGVRINSGKKSPQKVQEIIKTPVSQASTPGTGMFFTI